MTHYYEYHTFDYYYPSASSKNDESESLTSPENSRSNDVRLSTKIIPSCDHKYSWTR